MNVQYVGEHISRKWTMIFFAMIFMVADFYLVMPKTQKERWKWQLNGQSGI